MRLLQIDHLLWGGIELRSGSLENTNEIIVILKTIIFWSYSFIVPSTAAVFLLSNFLIRLAVSGSCDR